MVLDKTLLDVLCCAESWRTTVPRLLVRFPNTLSDHRPKLEPRCVLHVTKKNIVTTQKQSGCGSDSPSMLSLSPAVCLQRELLRVLSLGGKYVIISFSLDAKMVGGTDFKPTVSRSYC